VTVVTDSSPLVILSKIDCFDVLKELFSHLYISALQPYSGRMPMEC
jgi:predicted nucleic acid-binding protein